ncbi:MAG: carbohydrate kinase [Gammaproteobacteria bacterium]|nr:carbohydrate kinase [Gammaproteobacteria bacterium]
MPKQKVVALFGEVLVDVFPDRKVLGGAPFNVARHLRAFGLHPLLITRTGTDEIRDELLATMDKFGMDARGVQSDLAHPSGEVTVHIKGHEHQFEILPDRAYDYIHAGLAHMIALAVRPQLIYFGTLAQRGVISRRALTALLRSSKAPRLLDINLRKPWYDLPTVERSLQRADIVKLNEDELLLLASLLRLTGKTLEEQAAMLLRQFNLESILVTRGEKGAWQLARDSKVIHAAGEKMETPVVDSVGAGDGFTAVLILGMLSDWSMASTLSRANSFAAAICGIRGAIPASQDFYLPFLEEWKKCQPLRPKAQTLCTS